MRGRAARPYQAGGEDRVDADEAAALGLTVTGTIPGGVTVTGRKTWTTLGSACTGLLVVGRVDGGETDRPALKIARVDTHTQGVSLVEKPPLDFVPEVPHVAAVFDGAKAEAQEIIILDNGIPQELLFQLPITDIEVDGSNNKWIATATAGVFQVSPNGQETLAHFTKENSPLPSNNVQDVAIDDDSGEIYFATNKGLVSYQGTATAPSTTLENLHAYPNPVRPNFNGNVTIAGLTTNANVKITDVSGNLVFEDTAVGGSLQWDTTAFGRHKVASGVYLIIVTSADGFETKASKIMIVR